MSEPIYSVVIPVYNSAATLNRLNGEIMQCMNQMEAPYEIIYTDDQSTDNTWDTLLKLHNTHPEVRIVRLKENSGQWMALHAGTSVARGKHIIHMDDDLEYDPADIRLMAAKYRSGDYSIVYGIPKGKSQKHLSNKLFFKFRSNLLDRILGKQKTESFRYFTDDVMLDGDRKPKSSLHFEAQAKREVPQSKVGYVRVSYNSRHHGTSGYGIFKKIALISRYGPEHLKRPVLIWLLWLTSFLTLSFMVIVAGTTLPGMTGWLTAFLIALPCLMSFVIFFIITIYLIRSRIILKGRPDYIISEYR